MHRHKECACARVHTHTHTHTCRVLIKVQNRFINLMLQKKKSFLATCVISIPRQIIVISQHAT